MPHPRRLARHTRVMSLRGLVRTSDGVRLCRWCRCHGGAGARRGTATGSAGERLRVERGQAREVAQDRGELLGGPRLAAVAATLAEADEAEHAGGLVLGDGQVAGRRVAVAGAGGGAEAEAPAGDDDGAAVIPDLAHLEDGRLATPAHDRASPRRPPGSGSPRAVCGCAGGGATPYRDRQLRLTG